MTILAQGNTTTLGFGLGGIIRGIGAIAGNVAGLIPGVGPIIGGLIPGGKSSCPPGTACSGPSALGICLGACKPFPLQGPGGVLPGETQCPAGFRLEPGPGNRLQCVEEQAGQVGTGVTTTAGGTCPGVCLSPGGQRGRLKTVTQKGQLVTRCVANRRVNPMNPRAARRAVSRLNGAVKQLRNIESLVKGIPIQRAPRSRRAPSRAKGCGC